jgi:hypothetical protein
MKMAENEASMDKQIRVIKFSMIPGFIAVFVTGFYFLYLKTIGVEVSGWFYFDTMLLVILLTSVACLILNEALLKILYGESLRFKRLIFRCAVIAMYVFLVWAASSFVSIVFSQIGLLFQFLFGALLATAIFVIIILRFRRLFNRLDRG